MRSNTTSNLGNQSEMATAEGRCGPLCQHPGCWYSGEKHKVAYHKSQGYLTYLASKRSPVAEQQCNCTVEDGLPTLKIQTLDEGSIVSGDRALGSHRRARTLPSLGTRTRCKTPGSDLPPSTSRRLTFAHMVLEHDSNTTAADEVTFSPVLIWKPGRRISRPPRTAEEGGAPVWDTCASSSGGIGKAGVTRSQVALRTMNLTDVLPPERSESARSGGGRSGGRKGMPRSTKGHRQPPTANVESFSYLGDIPPHVVAHILEQLRSESSSHIDDGRSRPITSTSVHRQLQVEMEAANANVNTNNNNDGGHIPSSLVHDLSTGKQYRTSEHHYVTPPHSSRHTYACAGTRRKTFDSFSRELSRRPLEVLRRHSVRPSLEGVAEGTGRQTQEGILQHQTEADSRNTARVSLGAAHTFSPPLPLEKPLKQWLPRQPVDGASAAYSTAGIHPSLAGTRYPHGNPVVPRLPQQSEEKSALFGTGISMRKDTRCAKVPIGKSAIKNTLFLPDDLTLPGPSASPRTVTFQAGILGSLTEAELSSRVAARRKSPQSPKRSSRVVHVPRHNPPASADSHTLRPFSEEESSIVTSSETKPISKPSVPSAPQPPEVPQSQESSSHQLLHPRPESLSPDCMLVGAHISGDQLVLLDGGSQIVHQLTDTESDTNVLACAEAHAYVVYSTSSSENPISGSLEPPCTGTRAPPSTASHGVKLKPRETATQGNEGDRDEHESVQTSADHKQNTGTGIAAETTPVHDFEPSSPSVHEVELSEVTAGGDPQMTPASAAHEGPEVSHGSEGGTRSSSTDGRKHHCSGSLDCADTSQGALDSQANADTTGRDETFKQENRSSESIDMQCHSQESSSQAETLNDPNQPK